MGRMVGKLFASLRTCMFSRCMLYCPGSVFYQGSGKLDKFLRLVSIRHSQKF